MKKNIKLANEKAKPARGKNGIKRKKNEDYLFTNCWFLFSDFMGSWWKRSFNSTTYFSFVSSLTLGKYLCIRLSTPLSTALVVSQTRLLTCDCGRSVWLMQVRIVATFWESPTVRVHVLQSVMRSVLMHARHSDRGFWGSCSTVFILF